MITPAEKDFILENAYLPEHLPDYASGVSGGEPFLAADFVFYLLPASLVFVGFPLRGRFEEKKMTKTLEEVVVRQSPSRVALIAPAIPPRLGTSGPADSYYRLDLEGFRIPVKVKNMVQRASRELQVRKGKELESDHLRLISEFSGARPLEEGTRSIFSRIPKYLCASPTAWVFSARTGHGDLSAFDIAEFPPSGYAFYMFNFRSREKNVPGASDLLLSEIVRTAQEQGKRAINLGLGIHPGVVFFKKKWGGRPFLELRSVSYEPSPSAFPESLLSKL
jgi:hypothetical protein